MAETSQKSKSTFIEFPTFWLVYGIINYFLLIFLVSSISKRIEILFQETEFQILSVLMSTSCFVFPFFMFFHINYVKTNYAFYNYLRWGLVCFPVMVLVYYLI